MAVGFGRQGLLVKYNFVNAAIVVLTLTAGSAFLMWIGERITEKGVGNGISIVLVINIISRIPSDMKTLFDQFVKGKAIASAGLAVCVIIAIILALVGLPGRIPGINPPLFFILFAISNGLNVIEV